MRTEDHKLYRGSVRRALPLLLCSLIFALNAFAGNYPSWWTNRNVIAFVTATNDYAAVNAGQLKWFATNAAAELEANLPGGAGTSVWSLVLGLSSTNNYYAVNIGQLENVAKPFYDRLISEGYTNAYPWTGIAQTNDYAMANIGQVKNLFSFDLTKDTDADSLPDWWEQRHFGGLGETPAGDFDNDGLSNLAEFQAGTVPTDCDTDGDGMWDGWEAAHGLNPRADDSAGDSDNDGISNLAEFRSRALAVDVIIGDPGLPADDSWDVRMNGRLAAACRNGITGRETVYIPYGSRVGFTLHRVETGQGATTNEYALSFELLADPAGLIPWIPAESNSAMQGAVVYPFDTGGIRWEYVVPELTKIRVIEGGSGDSAIGPGNSPLNRALVRVGEPVSLKAVLSPESPVAVGEPAFIAWTVLDSPPGERDSDGDGICNNIDTLPNAVSDTFSDVVLGGTTTGLILDRGDRIFEIFDAEGPAQGVHIIVSAGSLPAWIKTTNSVPYTIITIPAGTNADFILMCGSSAVQLLAGRLELEVQGVGAAITATLEAGCSISFEPIDPRTLKIVLLESSGSAIRLSVNGEPPVILLPGWSLLVSFASDIDGDGVLDGVDEYPNSDMRPTVVIGGMDTGVPNKLFPSGYTISDKIAAIAASAKNLGDFVSGVTQLVTDLRKQGVITNKQASAIVNAAAKSGIGKPRN